MATQQLLPFRYPNQSLNDVELIEEVVIRRTGMTAAEVEAAYGSPHPRSADHALVWQEPVLTRDGVLSMRRSYRKLPGVALVGESVRENTLGVPATITVQDVATGTPAETGLHVLDSVVEPKDAQVARRRTTTVEWPTLTSTRLNSRGDLETVVESKAAPGTALPPVTVATTEVHLQAETVERSRLAVASVASHAELVDKKHGDAALIPARLRAAEGYRTTDVIVEPGTEPDALSSTVIESAIVGKTRNRSVKRTVSRAGGALPSVTDHKLGPHGELLQITESLVASGTVPAGSFGVISDAVHDTGGGVAVRTTEQLAADAFPVLTERAIDLQTQTAMTITRQIVPSGTALVSDGPLVIDQKVNAIDRWRSLQIITRLDALPAAYQERKHLRYRFPGLFYGFVPETPTSGIATFRHSESRVVTALVEVSFGYEEVVPELLEIQPVSWSYPLGFTVSNVLTNGETFVYEDRTTSYDLNVPVSTPTRAAYEALIGTYATVTGVSERWKGGIYRTELWKVKLE